MLDIKYVRENQEAVAEAMRNRNASWDAERFSSLDESRRAAIVKEEALQQERNAASKSIGEMMREGKKEEAEAAKERVRAINEELDEISAKREAVDAELHDLMLHVPNIPCAATPVGKDETENPERRRWGTPRDFAAEGFEPKPHWDLGTDLDILDFERGNKISGSRFTVLGGAGARLERALINYFLDTHTSRGFKEWWPPVVVKRETMVGTGQLPKFEDDAYHVSGDMFLIPTAEVTLTNLHAGEVEMVKFATPEDSDNQLESMTAEAEYLLQQLGLPYRVISLCTGDLGFSARQTYDVEVWLPSYNGYKEISSCSNCGDFQARRANIKYRDPANFKGSRYLHTLNGSGLPAGRTMAAIMENYQQADGTIKVPDVLVPYMGTDVIKPVE